MVMFHFDLVVNFRQIAQEYTEEFRDIAAGKVKKGPSVVGDQGNITLLHQRPVGDDLPVIMLIYYFLLLCYTKDTLKEMDYHSIFGHCPYSRIF